MGLRASDEVFTDREHTTARNYARRYYHEHYEYLYPIVKERNRKWYIANRERAKENARRWSANHADQVRENARKGAHRRYTQNPLRNLRYQRQYDQKLREQVYRAYSPSLKCQWENCDWHDMRALTLDHIIATHEGQHRKLSGRQFYLYLVNNNFPLGFQVLCMNHQRIKIIENHEIKPLSTKRKCINLRARNVRLKYKVILHYSPNMVCQWPGCDCTDLRALSVDHIDGNGAAHRREMNLKGGNIFYQYLVNANFPEGYQILCMNHQWVKKAMNDEVHRKYPKVKTVEPPAQSAQTATNTGNSHITNETSLVRRDSEIK